MGATTVTAIDLLLVLLWKQTMIHEILGQIFIIQVTASSRSDMIQKS